MRLIPSTSGPDDGPFKPVITLITAAKVQHPFIIAAEYDRAVDALDKAEHFCKMLETYACRYVLDILQDAVAGEPKANRADLAIRYSIGKDSVPQMLVYHRPLGETAIALRFSDAQVEEAFTFFGTCLAEPLGG